MMFLQKIKEFLNSNMMGDIIILVGFCFLLVLLGLPLMREKIAWQLISCCILLCPFSSKPVR